MLQVLMFTWHAEGMLMFTWHEERVNVTGVDVYIACRGDVILQVLMF